MASIKHDGLVALFRNRPTLAAELLQGPLGVALPAWSEARVESSDFTQVVTTEYRADLVILLFEGKPVFAIVVEVQLSRDDEKRASWPVYLTSLRARLSCPTVLLVVAPNRAVARWCAKPIELGHPGFVLQPLVAGPSAIPLILGKQANGQEPELAVLSALAHGHDAKLAPALFEAVVSSAQSLDNERLSFYIDLAVSAFGGAARSALEAFMQSGNYQYQSELVRKLVGHGLEKGLKKGLKEGRLEGEHRALFKVLKARGFTVDDAARRRILSCTELDQLERWLGKAVTVSSVQELFKHTLTAKPAVRRTGSHNRSVKARKPRAKR
ncbi:MAG TPA: hypothetical protein VNA24_17210 [Hyalangium sp.]|jgi:hypothetical protein|nr:hypothetical protein [Hyalangium sp.]